MWYLMEEADASTLIPWDSEEATFSLHRVIRSREATREAEIVHALERPGNP
jgi:hypothetical protein